MYVPFQVWPHADSSRILSEIRHLRVPAHQGKQACYEALQHLVGCTGEAKVADGNQYFNIRIFL